MEGTRDILGLTAMVPGIILTPTLDRFHSFGWGEFFMAARRVTPRGKRKILKGKELPFKKKNYLLLLIGLVVIGIGYIALAQPPADNPWSLTVAPILLVLGYCVIIPIAIMLKGKGKDQEDDKS